MSYQCIRTTVRRWAELAVVLISVLSSRVAWAHGTTITEAVPALDSMIATSPTQVMVRFSEELDSQSGVMKVLDVAGRQVSEGNGKLDLNDAEHQVMLATLRNPLGDGVYTVWYHVVLVDGDATDGSYTFTVEAAVTQPATATTPAPPVTASSSATAAPTEAAALVLPASSTAQPASEAPDTLPQTGVSARVPAVYWPVVLGIVLLAVGSTAATRRRAR